LDLAIWSSEEPFYEFINIGCGDKTKKPEFFQ